MTQLYSNAIIEKWPNCYYNEPHKWEQMWRLTLLQKQTASKVLIRQTHVNYTSGVFGLCECCLAAYISQPHKRHSPHLPSHFWPQQCRNAKAENQWEVMASHTIVGITPPPPSTHTHTHTHRSKTHSFGGEMINLFRSCWFFRRVSFLNGTSQLDTSWPIVLADSGLPVTHLEYISHWLT